MRTVHVFLLALLLALPALASAQEAPPIERAMTADEFKAAGLDKLSGKELSALNAWLQGKVQAESSQAAEQARRETAQQIEKAKEEGRQEVIVKNRGFFDFGSSEPIASTLVGEFAGFGKGRQYTLENGQVWDQTDDARVSGVRKQSPKVKITPGLMGVWYLQIEGVNTRAKVRRSK